MPKAFDDMVSAVKISLKKQNPKMKDDELDSKAYAMATAQWKKMHGKAPSRESVKDWRLLEFFVPIQEKVSIGEDFMIRGIAINETTTRNGISYIAEELEMGAPSFRSKPILLDHSNSVKDIVGRTTENVNYNPIKRAIEFEAKIMDEKIKEMIKDGRITDVSIGAKVKDLVEDKEKGTITAMGMEGLEISLVAVPGDPGANLANALSNSFMIKESLRVDEVIIENINEDIKEDINEDTKEDINEQTMSEDEIRKQCKKDHPEWDEKQIEDMVKKVMMKGKEKEEYLEYSKLTKMKGGNNIMADVEKITEEATVKTEAKEVIGMEKSHETIVNNNVDMSAVVEVLKDFKAEMKSMREEMNAIKVAKESITSNNSPVKNESIENKTKGIVGNKEVVEDTNSDSLVVERADYGEGFAIYKDYNKDLTGKFKRLVRN